jgi:hypothetical protein
MRRDKNTRLDIELLVHRTPGEAIQEGLERPANQYVALDKTACNAIVNRNRHAVLCKIEIERDQD